MLRSLIFACLVAVTAPLGFASTWTFEPNCDETSEPRHILKQKSAAECQAACEEDKGCHGLVHVSGWNRCLLKDDLKKKTKLKFISADMDEARTFKVEMLRPDHDHTGKDKERRVLDSAEACGRACESTAGCGAITYLEGYRVCWLKASGGKLNPKVFSCAAKPEAKAP